MLDVGLMRACINFLVHWRRCHQPCLRVSVLWTYARSLYACIRWVRVAAYVYMCGCVCTHVHVHVRISLCIHLRESVLVNHPNLARMLSSARVYAYLIFVLCMFVHVCEFARDTSEFVQRQHTSACVCIILLKHACACVGMCICT